MKYIILLILGLLVISSCTDDDVVEEIEVIEEFVDTIPSIVINSPADFTTYTFGETILFDITVKDDKRIAQVDLESLRDWFTNRLDETSIFFGECEKDRTIESSVWVSEFPNGDYLIEAKVTDSDGNMARDTVSVTIIQ